MTQKCFVLWLLKDSTQVQGSHEPWSLWDMWKSNFDLGTGMGKGLFHLKRGWGGGRKLFWPIPPNSELVEPPSPQILNYLIQHTPEFWKKFETPILEKISWPSYWFQNLTPNSELFSVYVRQSSCRNALIECIHLGVIPESPVKLSP